MIMFQVHAVVGFCTSILLLISPGMTSESCWDFLHVLPMPKLPGSFFNEKRLLNRCWSRALFLTGRSAYFSASSQRCSHRFGATCRLSIDFFVTTVVSGPLGVAMYAG